MITSQNFKYTVTKHYSCRFQCPNTCNQGGIEVVGSSVFTKVQSQLSILWLLKLVLVSFSRILRRSNRDPNPPIKFNNFRNNKNRNLHICVFNQILIQAIRRLALFNISIMPETLQEISKTFYIEGSNQESGNSIYTGLFKKSNRKMRKISRPTFHIFVSIK